MLRTDPDGKLLNVPRTLFWLSIALGLSGFLAAPSPFIPTFLWFIPVALGVWGLLYLQKNSGRARVQVTWLKEKFTRYRVDLAIAVLVGCGAFVVYRLTMAPGLVDLERDTLGHINGLQAGIPIGSTGYPVYVWVVQFFRLLPHNSEAVAFHFNLFSAVFAALSSILLFLLSTALVEFTTGDQNYPLRRKLFWPWARRALSLLLTFLYCFSPIFWFYGTIAEVYSFNVFIILIVFIFLLLWLRTRDILSLLGTCFFLGISIGSHITNALILPAFALITILSISDHGNRFKIWLKGLGVFLAGALQYLWIPFALSGDGENGLSMIMSYFISWFQQGAFAQRSFGYPLLEVPGRLATFISYNVEQFAWLGLILGVMGLVFLWRRSKLLLLFFFFSFTAQVIYLTQYIAEDWWTYLTINHLIWALFILMGLLMLLSWIWSLVRVLSIWYKRVLMVFLFVCFLLGLALPIVRRWPMRDLSKATYLDDFLSLAFDLMLPGSQVFDMLSIYGYEEEKQISYYQMYKQQDFDVVSLNLRRAVPRQLEGSTYAIFSFEDIKVFLRSQEETLTTPVPILYGNYSPDRTNVYPLSSINYPLVLFTFAEDYRPYLISDSKPAVAKPYALQDLTWRGYTLHDSAISDQILAVDLFWTIPAPEQDILPRRVVFWVGDRAIGEYPVGQGLLQDYLHVNPTSESLAFRDPVHMVLPSSLPSGQLPLAIQICMAHVCSEPPMPLETIPIP